MEAITLFKITSNSDTIEGRGHELIHGYSRDLETVKEIVQDPRVSHSSPEQAKPDNDQEHPEGQ